MNHNRATGLRTPSIELCAIAMLAHCARTRSALHLAACTQRDNSTMGLARRRRGPAERVIGAIDPKRRCCMALWMGTPMRSSKRRSSKVEGCRDLFAKSLKPTCVADGWNRVSFVQNARGVVTSTWWRLAVSVAAGAPRARRGVWPRAALI